jgi:hypothetical protein
MKKTREQQMARQRERQRESVKRYMDSRRTKEPSNYSKKMAEGMQKRREIDGFRCILSGATRFDVAHLIGRNVGRYKRYNPLDPKNMMCLNRELHRDFDKNTNVDKRIDWLREHALHQFAERLIWLTTPDDRDMPKSHYGTEASE